MFSMPDLRHCQAAYRKHFLNAVYIRGFIQLLKYGYRLVTEKEYNIHVRYTK